MVERHSGSLSTPVCSSSLRLKDMKKLAVLGATGPTGLEVVKQALEAGHSVTAVVRTPEKLPEDIRNNERLTCAKGDVFSAESLSPHLAGLDAVLSALGVHGVGMKLPFQQPMTFYEDSGRAIVDAMKQNQVRRLIAITSMCTKKEAGNPAAIEYLVRPFMIARHLESMGRMEDLLDAELEHIDFTVARPPGLGKGPSKGQEILAQEGQCIPNASLWVEMPRADVAKFMLGCLDSDEWKGKFVAIHVKT